MALEEAVAFKNQRNIVVQITGGRDYAERETVYRALDGLHKAHCITLVRHGCARGADTLAGAWACARGIAQDKHPADWEAYGKAAGAIRNRAMLNASPKAALLLAFPGGKGTKNMITICQTAKLPIIIVREVTE